MKKIEVEIVDCLKTEIKQLDDLGFSWSLRKVEA